MGVFLLLRADGRFGMTEAEKEFAALMRRIREGSEEAFCEVIDRYGTPLLKSIRGRLSRTLRRVFDSRDFFQAVWASFLTDQKARSFRSPQSLVAYLNLMARNQILDEVRRRRLGRSPVPPAQSLTAADSSFSNLDVPSREPRPISVVANRELLQKMRDVLSETERRIIELVQHGCTQEEVARRIGVCSRTVGRAVNRARRILNEISEESVP
jgi:RNA polymerase sigma factor (sigma-70 family)